MQHLQKTRERGLRTSNRQRLRNAQSDVAHLSFFSTTCAMPILQALSFDIHPSNGGGWGGYLEVLSGGQRNLGVDQLRDSRKAAAGLRRSAAQGVSTRSTRKWRRPRFGRESVQTLP